MNRFWDRAERETRRNPVAFILFPQSVASLLATYTGRSFFVSMRWGYASGGPFQHSKSFVRKATCCWPNTPARLGWQRCDISKLPKQQFQKHPSVRGILWLSVCIFTYLSRYQTRHGGRAAYKLRIAAPHSGMQSLS